MRNVILSLLAFLLSVGAQSQTDDLMIIEYVDWDQGSGVGVKIYNPTDQPIDLSEYLIATYHNGNTTTGTSGALSGMLQPNAIKIYGNGAYCNQCPSACNTLTINGVDGNDVVAIVKDITIIDMVGPLGADVDIEVNGVSGALLHNKLFRNADNCTRYYNLAGSGAHSWPDNEQVNVDTWTVVNVGCIDQSGFSPDVPDLQLQEDTTICEGEELALDLSFLNYDQYEWLGQNNQTPAIVIKDSGTYVLQVSTALFCSDSDSIVVATEQCDTITPPPPPPPTPVDSAEVFIPNIITPNQDNHNEAFVLSGFTETVSLTVYNRWGVRVYENTDYQNDWQGGDLADGVYFYQVREGFAELNGWLQIRR